MRISEVSVQNFRLLHRFHLDLSTEANNLIFINGSNGHGKTSLLTSFRWCFFGEQISPTDFSYAELKAGNPSGEYAIEVVVRFVMNADGDMAQVRRSQPVQVNEQGRPRFEEKAELTITETYADTARPSLVVPDPEAWLDSHLPRRFKSFFLFDGELMYKFFDVSVKGAIEDAVREIANIDLFENVVETLQGQKDRLNTKLGKLSGSDAERIGRALSESERTYNGVIANVRKVQSEIDVEKSAKEALSSELKGYEEASKFLEENKSLRERQASERDRLEALNQRLTRSLFETGTFAFLLSRVRYPLNKHVSAAAEAGRYPADFQPKALEHLLEAGKCICGRHLREAEEEYKSIEAVIRTSINAGDLGNELQKIARGVAQAEALCDSGHRSLLTLRQDFAASKRALEDLNRNLDRLAPQLQGVKGNEDHIKDVAKRLRIAENAYTDALRQLDILKIQSLQALTAVNDLKKKFDKATANTEEATALKGRIEFLNKALSQANTFNSEILEGVRKKLEEFVSRYFSKVKGGSLKTRISEDFEVETLTADGTLAKLSEGEKMLKAYIFSIALREVVGLSFPLIVDTPFGRLDEENRSIVSETLRELLGEESRHQVVFMMHDGEYTPYTKRDFDPVRPFESFLDWNAEAGVSSLSLGIDPDWLKRTAWRDWSRGVLSE